MIPDRDFTQQQSVDGGRSAGGIIPDFVVFSGSASPLVLAVHGRYWHAGSFYNLEKSRRDTARLTGLGYDVVTVWDDDLANRLDYTMSQAVDHRQEVTERPLPW